MAPIRPRSKPFVGHQLNSDPALLASPSVDAVGGDGAAPILAIQLFEVLENEVSDVVDVVRARVRSEDGDVERDRLVEKVGEDRAPFFSVLDQLVAREAGPWLPFAVASLG
jgi:hypothetical protein